jgi:phosphatidylglycerophosphate synthase
MVVEETVDLFLFRPIAFVLVKATYRLPITPNQISVLSMLAGIASGIFYAMGDRTAFIYAGLLYALAHVLDCCDGMVARLKNNGTQLGRIIDGWADYVTATAVYIGLLIGLHNGSFHLPVSSPWLLMVPASISLAVHSVVVDYYRHEFLAHALGKANPIRQDHETFSKRLDLLRREKRNYFEILLISFYLGYTKMQLKESNDMKEYPEEAYYQSNKLLLLLWNWIGAATHIFVLIVATLLYEPMIFFVYSLGLANLWMLVMAAIQIRTNKRIALKHNA